MSLPSLPNTWITPVLATVGAREAPPLARIVARRVAADRDVVGASVPNSVDHAAGDRRGRPGTRGCSPVPPSSTSVPALPISTSSPSPPSSMSLPAPPIRMSLPSPPSKTSCGANARRAPRRRSRRRRPSPLIWIGRRRRRSPRSRPGWRGRRPRACRRTIDSAIVSLPLVPLITTVSAARRRRRRRRAPRSTLTVLTSVPAEVVDRDDVGAAAAR